MIAESIGRILDIKVININGIGAGDLEESVVPVDIQWAGGAGLKEIDAGGAVDGEVSGEDGEIVSGGTEFIVEGGTGIEREVAESKSSDTAVSGGDMAAGIITDRSGNGARSSKNCGTVNRDRSSPGGGRGTGVCDEESAIADDGSTGVSIASREIHGTLARQCQCADAADDAGHAQCRTRGRLKRASADVEVDRTVIGSRGSVVKADIGGGLQSAAAEGDGRCRTLTSQVAVRGDGDGSLIDEGLTGVAVAGVAEVEVPDTGFDQGGGSAGSSVGNGGADGEIAGSAVLDD